MCRGWVSRNARRANGSLSGPAVNRTDGKDGTGSASAAIVLIGQQFLDALAFERLFVEQRLRQSL
jgi:hypothetical protein